MGDERRSKLLKNLSIIQPKQSIIIIGYALLKQQ
jgi:hypothetical protein